MTYDRVAGMKPLMDEAFNQVIHKCDEMNALCLEEDLEASQIGTSASAQNKNGTNVTPTIQESA